LKKKIEREAAESIYKDSLQKRGQKNKVETLLGCFNGRKPSPTEAMDKRSYNSIFGSDGTNPTVLNGTGN